LVLDGANGLLAANHELKLEVVLSTIIDPERGKWPQNAYKWAGIALLTSPTGSEIIFC